VPLTIKLIIHIKMKECVIQRAKNKIMESVIFKKDNAIVEINNLVNGVKKIMN